MSTWNNTYIEDKNGSTDTLQMQKGCTTAIIISLIYYFVCMLEFVDSKFQKADMCLSYIQIP